MMVQTIKEGYKQTEIGVIPSDWNMLEFQEVMDGFSSGQTPYRAKPEFYTGNIPWITSGELNYNVITDTKEKITIEGVQDALLKTIPVGTFLFAITGLEAAGTRGSCAITGVAATTNQSCMALYPKKGLLITPYLYHFYVRYGNELAFKYCQGTKQQSFTGGIAKKLPIVVPPTIAEQTLIATALSDADALISSLEKLIAKKRNIKQGAMQQLLIDNCQLSIDNEGWEVKKLGELITYKNGKSFESLIDENGGYLLITLNSIDIKGELKKEHLRVKEFDNSLEKGDLIMVLSDVAHGNFLGLTDVIPENNLYVLNQRMGALKNLKGVIPRFLSLYINHFQSYFKLSGKGSSQQNLGKGDILKFEINLPSIVEQTRIATILSDMDAEIGALETKLEKYKKVKLGMMQELLTGKIRLNYDF